MPETKTYLGDSVYAELMENGGAIKLTTENGLPQDPTNEIFMEPNVLDALERFRRSAKQVEAFGRKIPQLESIAYEKQQLNRREQAVIALASLCVGLDEVPAFTTAGDSLDFDRLNHEQVIAVMKHLKAGKWTKELNADGVTLDYVNDTLIAGWKVRLWSATPPATCKLVEVEVDVEEQIIPAHKKKQFKLVCKEEVTAETFAETAVQS